MASTDFKDYYAVLGLSKTATAAQIKQKFRQLALKYHPDRNPGNPKAEARFKEISEAYEVLGDSDKRKKYDQFGQYWQQAGQAKTGWNNTTNVGVDFGGFDFSRYGNFDEFINELLGKFSTTETASSNQTYSYNTGTNKSPYTDFSGFSHKTQAKTSQSGDREANISLSYAEAFQGVNKTLKLGNESMQIRIPPGAKTGSRIRVKGKGNINPLTKQAGDLYLKVQLQPHNFFQFEGDNLVCEIPITPDEAVLGVEIPVPTPDGVVNMKVPGGIRSGQSLRLRGKGWPNPKGKRGDQLVKILIATPQSISPQEREYYEKIRRHRTFNPRTNLAQIRL